MSVEIGTGQNRDGKNKLCGDCGQRLTFSEYLTGPGYRVLICQGCHTIHTLEWRGLGIVLGILPVLMMAFWLLVGVVAAYVIMPSVLHLMSTEGAERCVGRGCAVQSFTPVIVCIAAVAGVALFTTKYIMRAIRWLLARTQKADIQNLTSHL